MFPCTLYYFLSYITHQTHQTFISQWPQVLRSRGRRHKVWLDNMTTSFNSMLLLNETSLLWGWMTHSFLHRGILGSLSNI
uniref:Uncharacterized protein n=1 Tax=Picea glauca TaxID=3330 RepID=A0A101M4Z2_PICGL|nr:hypothetical protein ABT39_MTgene833 [Picea glauca]